MARSEAIRIAHELLSESQFNVAQRGVRAAFGVAPPALLASGARHYSLIKAADLLGIGRENLQAQHVLVEACSAFKIVHVKRRLDHAVELRQRRAHLHITTY